MIDKKINFVLVYGAKCNSYFKNDGTATVKVRAYRNAEIRYFSTGVFLKPNQWNDRAQKVKNHEMQTELNQRLREFLTQLETYEAEQVKKFGSLSLKSLDNAFSKSRGMTFTEFYQAQVNEMPKGNSTKKSHQNTLNKLLLFRPKGISFEELDYKLLKSFEQFLRAQNLMQNTIHKNFKNVRTYTNEAIKHDLLDMNRTPFLKFKISTEKTEKTPLTPCELRALEQWTPPAGSEHLQIIKDFFLVCCYSGLRFGDVAKLCGNNFEQTDKGLIMSIKTEKVGKPFVINTRLLFPGPWSNDLDQAQAVQAYSRLEKILLYYIERAAFLGKAHPIIKISNKHLNENLKVIFAQIPTINTELSEKISTHYGRHTFSTIMSQKVPAPVLKELLQHSDLKITQGYINLSQDDQNRHLQNAIW
jgi:integrase